MVASYSTILDEKPLCQLLLALAFSKNTLVLTFSIRLSPGALDLATHFHTRGSGRNRHRQRRELSGRAACQGRDGDGAAAPGGAGGVLSGGPSRTSHVDRVLAEPSANARRVLTYERLLGRVWDGNGDGAVRPLRTIVGKLRRKLGDDADNPAYVFTEPRVGYRMPEGEAGGERPATP